MTHKPQYDIQINSTPIEKSPEEYDECNEITNEGRKTYCNKIQYLDNVIADYINSFKTYNLWDDTLLIFSTDNGGMPHWKDDRDDVAVSYVHMCCICVISF